MLLSPNAPSAPRISQLLPTVKCSSCSESVPLNLLGDHVCAGPSTVSSSSSSSTPQSTISERRGNDSLSLNSLSSDSSRRPDFRPKAGSPLREHSSAMSVSSFNTTSSRTRSNSNASSYRRPSVSSVRRSISSSSTSPPPTSSLPPIPSTPKTPQTPHRTGTPMSPPIRQMTPSLSTNKLSVSPRMAHQLPPSLIAAHGHPERSMSAAATVLSGPSISSRERKVSTGSVAIPSPPSMSRERNLSAGSVGVPPPIPRERNLSAGSLGLPTPPSISRESLGNVGMPGLPMSSRPATPAASIHTQQHVELDTKIGGEAGMAGVGRRGFAAAAQAAMFIQPPMGFRRPSAPQVLDIDAAIRATATPPLTASGYSSSYSNGPVSPLSPFSQHIPSPVFPAKTGPSDLPPSQNRPLDPRTPSPYAPDTPRANTPSRSFSKDTTTSSTSGLRISMGSTVKSKSNKRRSAQTDRSSGSEYGLAYADSTDYEDDDDNEDENNDDHDNEDTNKSRHISGRSSYGALLKSKAEPPPPLPLGGSILQGGFRDTELHRSRSSSSSSSSNYSDSETTPISKPSHTRQNSTKIAQALGLSQNSPGAYASGRLGGPGRPSISKNGNDLEREVDKLLDEVDGPLSASPTIDSFNKDDSTLAVGGTRPLLSGARRSNTVAAPNIRKASEDSIAAKLPARANTEKASSSAAADREKERRKKVKTCLRCEKRVEDGRWVKVDSGGGLCEKCWKNMYLPKCRRCSKPIEKQAVSSSDGQLKGKYHKDCFNCAQCHKPFPDKIFYVYDGKPMCAYHYAEANDSLCSAATCGQPIEGPCAVSHVGDRYHPEHLLCEYPSGVPGKQGCMKRLEEYWEFDGRMLCERHANIMQRRAGGSDDDEDYEEGVNSTKAMKRTTRFIDLNLGFGAENGGGLGASGLR